MNGVQKFQIHRDDRSTDRLPSAHTWFVLKYPCHIKNYSLNETIYNFVEIRLSMQALGTKGKAFYLNA